MTKGKEFKNRMEAYSSAVHRMSENEKHFEEHIEGYLISEEGSWTKATDDGYCSEDSRGMALDIITLTNFVQATQPMAWRRFERMCTIGPIRQFYKAFENAVTQDGLISVLRHGFKHRGINFRICYFKPESELNELANEHYCQNVCQCIRQWHYTEANKNSIEMMPCVNGNTTETQKNMLSVLISVFWHISLVTSTMYI